MLMRAPAISLKVSTSKGARKVPGIIWKFEGACQNDRGREAFSWQGPGVFDSL